MKRPAGPKISAKAAARLVRMINAASARGMTVDCDGSSGWIHGVIRLSEDYARPAMVGSFGLSVAHLSEVTCAGVAVPLAFEAGLIDAAYRDACETSGYAASERATTDATLERARVEVARREAASAKYEADARREREARESLAGE